MDASETSPLLSREPTHSFPSISGALLRLGDRVGRTSIEEVCPRDLGDVCKETAFRLIVLLELRTKKLRQKPHSDVWNNWVQLATNENDIARLDEQVVNAWVLFLDGYRTTAEIEQVLWTAFAVNDDSSRRVRVVDLLNLDCPSQLICHDVVILSLANFWKYGSSREVAARTNFSSGIGLRYDAICTPRVLHGMDLVAHLVYLGVLVSYVMHPPTEPTISSTSLELDYIGPREILLMLFSSSILIRPWTIFNLPFAFTLLMFLSSLRAGGVPFAGSASFNILLLCFAFHVFQLHFPRSPSPLFLFKVHQSLPFAGFLAHGFSHIILPITLFFIPVSLLGISWLSMALAETFFSPFALAPTPIETRNTVLFMIFAVCAAILCSLFVFVVQGRGLDTNASGWDVYSPTVGREARASFVQAVIAYSSPYTFPAPFSLLHALLISGPSFLLVNCLRFRLPFAQAEKILWRMTVGPVGLVFALAMWLLP
ncbi:hypothetical protein C8R44DRAFT_772916 [Mycena epipterygia]|nr:hypothetical protein C8R44DRAFT_772916 [Mycena epipterygia]